MTLAKWILGGVLCGSLSIIGPLAQAQPEVSGETPLAPIELAQEVAPSSPNITPDSISPISTSRPSFTDASTRVLKGSVQVESGATFYRNNQDIQTWTVPETLLRVGLFNNTEFRYTAPVYTDIHSKNTGTVVNNFGDMSVGLSQHFSLPYKIDLAVIPILNIPTGANKASSNSVDPQLRLAWSKNITPKFLLGGHLDTRWYTGKNAPADVVFNPTIIGYYSWTDRLCTFLEYAPFIPTKGRSSQYLQAGALFLTTKRQQLDFRIATGLNDNTPDFLVGFGYSFRLDGLFGK